MHGKINEVFFTTHGIVEINTLAKMKSLSTINAVFVLPLAKNGWYDT